MNTTTTDYPHRVAQAVTGAMQAGGWSEKALAEATGIPRVTLRRRLGGSPFDVSELARIADALNVTVAYLIGEVAA